jgi:hypothetical protein
VTAVYFDDDVRAWLGHGERGLSSEFIVSHLCGIPLIGRSWGPAPTPADPDDVRRCRLLLEACPSLMVRFDEMRTASRTWELLVDIWDDLCELMDYEAPGMRGRCPETYEAIKRAEQLARDERRAAGVSAT